MNTANPLRISKQFFYLPVFIFAFLCVACAAEESKGVTHYRYTFIKSYPHDINSFTQGLFLYKGFLYESTGLNGRSSLRKLELSSGKVLQEAKLDRQYFAEGIVRVDNKIIQLTYKTRKGFVYDLTSFKLLETFHYSTEGWGLSFDGEYLIMSDGTAQLTFLDTKNYKPVKTIVVTYEGEPLSYINEMEFIDGKIFANIWQTNQIVIINPKTGVVTDLLDLSALSNSLKGSANIDVLNGIAWDEKSRHLLVTGKLWQKVFEIKISQF